jgi:archaetidylinositol phosphate synthase
LNRFRAFAEKLSKGPVDFFSRHNITPNKLSVIGFLLTLPPAFFIWLRFLSVPYLNWLIPTFIFVAGTFDAFDGSVARKMNLVTKYGGFLDSMLDRISDAVLIIGLTTGHYFDGPNDQNVSLGIFLGFWTLVSILLVSYIRSSAEKGGVDMKGVGVMERGERILIFVGGSIAYFWVQVGYGGSPAGDPAANAFFFWFLIVFTLMMNYTIIERVVFAVRNLRRMDRGEPPLVKGSKRKKTAETPVETAEDSLDQ